MKPTPVKKTKYFKNGLITEEYEGPVFAGTVKDGLFYPASPDDKIPKINAVTGAPRSGTSLAMQILDILGVAVAGTPPVVPTDFSDLELDTMDRKKRAKALNPLGFYEIGGTVVKGITAEKEAMRFAGKTVKIVASGMSKTDPAYVGKIILCLRNPAEILTSQENLTSDIIVQGEEGEVFSPKLMKKGPDTYVQQMGNLLRWISNNKKTEDVFSLNYEELQSEKAESVLTDLCHFLEIEPDSKKVAQAIAQIKPELYRSNKADWPDTEEAALAFTVYENLKNPKLISEVPEKLKKFFQEKINETRKWIDDSEFGLWRMIGSPLYRQLTENLHLQGQLLNTVDFTARCYLCTHHTKSNESYTIERGKNVPALTREKVSCSLDNDLKTVEECWTCWNNGVSDTGKAIVRIPMKQQGYNNTAYYS